MHFLSGLHAGVTVGGLVVPCAFGGNNMSRWATRRPGYYASVAAALPGFGTESCRLVASAYAALLERAEGEIPCKNGLDLSGIAPAMANVALAAVKLGSACVFRIAGEEIRSRFGRKLVGHNYYDLVNSARRSHAMRSMDMVVSVPCGFRVELIQRYSDGTELPAEACAFPLRSPDPEIDGFILFADESSALPARIRNSNPKLEEAVVVQRDLIDLGFGVDEGFEDLVRASK